MTLCCCRAATVSAVHTTGAKRDPCIRRTLRSHWRLMQATFTLLPAPPLWTAFTPQASDAGHVHTHTHTHAHTHTRTHTHTHTHTHIPVRKKGRCVIACSVNVSRATAHHHYDTANTCRVPCEAGLVPRTIPAASAWTRTVRMTRPVCSRPGPQQRMTHPVCSRPWPAWPFTAATGSFDAFRSACVRKIPHNSPVR